MWAQSECGKDQDTGIMLAPVINRGSAVWFGLAWLTRSTWLQSERLWELVLARLGLVLFEKHSFINYFYCKKMNQIIIMYRIAHTHYFLKLYPLNKIIYFHYQKTGENVSPLGNVHHQETFLYILHCTSHGSEVKISQAQCNEPRTTYVHCIWWTPESSEYSW